MQDAQRYKNRGLGSVEFQRAVVYGSAGGLTQHIAPLTLGIYVIHPHLAVGTGKVENNGLLVAPSYWNPTNNASCLHIICNNRSAVGTYPNSSTDSLLTVSS